MAISVRCDCGKAYWFKDSAAGKSIDCKECGAAISIPDAADSETDSMDFESIDPSSQSDDDASSDDGANRSSKRSSKPARRKKRPAGTSSGAASSQSLLGSLREIVSEITSAYSAASSSRKLALAIGAMIGVGVVGFVVWTFFLTTVINLLLIPLAFVCSPLAMFVLTDAYYRWWIRTEIESLGGTLHSIRWRPFQGKFFTRGWKLGRSCRFYQVTFKNRQGREQSELCGINLIRGAVWGDDIDEMQFMPILDARLEKWGLWAAITFAVALTTFFALNESAYALLGTERVANVTESKQHEVRFRQRGRQHVRTQTMVHYEWVDGAGATHQGRHDFVGAVSPQTLTIEHLPGGHGVRFPGPNFAKLWLRVCGYLALFFGLLYGLDYFDVFGVHASQRRRAASELK